MRLRKFEALVVLKKSFALFQKFDEVVLKKKPLSVEFRSVCTRGLVK